MRDRKRIRSQTKVFEKIVRIKWLKWKRAGHTARRQDNRWSANILQIMKNDQDDATVPNKVE